MNSNKSLQNRIGYQFQNPDLLTRALSHRSYGRSNNERLEFLGDALLGQIIGEALFERLPDAKEGQLTQLRASLVKGETLADIARGFGLGEYLLLGGGELKSGGYRRSSILADAVEAIIGAIYLDSQKQLSVCRDCVLDWYEERLAGLAADTAAKDAKTRLQEYLQERRRPLPQYQTLSEGGEAHARQFTVECHVDGLPAPGIGKGSSKRAAEKAAAAAVLQQFRAAST